MKDGKVERKQFKAPKRRGRGKRPASPVGPFREIVVEVFQIS